MEQLIIERLRDVTPSLDQTTVGKSSGGESRFAELVTKLLTEVNASQNAAESNADYERLRKIGRSESALLFVNRGKRDTPYFDRHLGMTNPTKFCPGKFWISGFPRLL